MNPYLFGALQNGEPRGLDLAGYGVSIFFVLSGFLITYLLQTEKEIQAINIKKFYLRRILRIWPLYYLYLVVVVAIMLVIGLDLNFKLLMLYIFYAANIPFIFGQTIPLLSHYWSLGVEEQFYLVWPWICKKVRPIALFVLLLIILLISTKIALHFYFPDSLFESVLYAARFHCLLIGSLGAILFKQNKVWFLKLLDNKLSQFICWTILLFAAVNKFHIASVIDNEIISLVALFIMVGQIKIKNRLVNLDKPVLNFLGKISYGIYVIHPLIIFLFSKIIRDLPINLPVKYLLVYLSITGVTILVSFISYTYFEKYFLRMKNKFVVVNSSDTKS